MNAFTTTTQTYDIASVQARVRYAQAAFRRADAIYMEHGPDADAAIIKKVDDALANLNEARDLLAKIS